MAPTTYDEALPALVRVGDPLRNIAPCISCHGQAIKSWASRGLEGMSKQYLLDQFVAFQQGIRRNDAHAQMRSTARSMTAQEMDEVRASMPARPANASERWAQGGQNK